jgi:hypothetical protein
MNSTVKNFNIDLNKFLCSIEALLLMKQLQERMQILNKDHRNNCTYFEINLNDYAVRIKKDCDCKNDEHESCTHGNKETQADSERKGYFNGWLSIPSGFTYELECMLFNKEKAREFLKDESAISDSGDYWYMFTVTFID